MASGAVDTEAGVGGAARRQTVPLAQRVRSVAAAVLLAAAVLVALRFVWHVPRPALMSAAALAGICTVVAVIVRPHARGWLRATATVSAWLILCAIAAAAVFYGDRSRWWWQVASGYNATLEETVAPSNGAALDIARRYGLFRVSDSEPNTLVVVAGQHDLNETLVVPAGFKIVIRPGAVLRFNSGCSLLSFGPVEARGTAERPIVFCARRDWLKWGAVGVVGAASATFEHVHVSNARHAVINGHDLPGAITLVETIALVAHCQFDSIYGKDALNLRGSHITVHDNHVFGGVQDGIDVDGGTGLVFRNELTDCGDDGIDLADNLRLEVFGNLVRGCKLTAEQDAAKVRLANSPPAVEGR